jgi:hypothetical protein
VALNDAYAGSTNAQGVSTGMQFVLDRVDYTDNSEWFSSCKSSSFTFRQSENVDSKKFINFYSQ